MNILSAAFGVMSDLYMIRRKNQEKIDKIIDEYYNDTPQLPRKLKKKRRKYLLKEYSFWKSVQAHYNETYNFN